MSTFWRWGSAAAVTRARDGPEGRGGGGEGRNWFRCGNCYRCHFFWSLSSVFLEENEDKERNEDEDGEEENDEDEEEEKDEE